MSQASYFSQTISSLLFWFFYFRKDSIQCNMCLSGLGICPYGLLGEAFSGLFKVVNQFFLGFILLLIIIIFGFWLEDLQFPCSWNSNSCEKNVYSRVNGWKHQCSQKLYHLYGHTHNLWAPRPFKNSLSAGVLLHVWCIIWAGIVSLCSRWGEKWALKG